MIEQDPKKALEELFTPSGDTSKSPESSKETSEMAEKAKKPSKAKSSKKPTVDMSIKDLILAAFKNDKSKELKISDVIESVHVKSPKTPENSIRSITTSLQKRGLLAVSRKEGRIVFLKLGSGKPLEPSKAPRGSRVAAAPQNAAKNDLQTIQEAISVLQRAEEIIKRYGLIQAALLTIGKA